uniref:(northern house mosquito) hypothetical protein n=1 Tax=Culex pipiens TaxID=7175 RepID=A0A8D8BPL0_CULPI
MNFQTHERLKGFIDRTGVLLKERSGFRKHHSCNLALNPMLLKWKQCIEVESFVLSVLVESKWAFETIDQKKLIGVLKKSGIRGPVLKWFISLSGCLGKPEADKQVVNLGVPIEYNTLVFVLRINHGTRKGYPRA